MFYYFLFYLHNKETSCRGIDYGGCECFIISCFTFRTRKLAAESMKMEVVSILLFLVSPSGQGDCGVGKVPDCQSPEQFSQSGNYYYISAEKPKLKCPPCFPHKLKHCIRNGAKDRWSRNKQMYKQKATRSGAGSLMTRHYRPQCNEIQTHKRLKRALS